jgi:hypothetical protein
MLAEEVDQRSYGVQSEGVVREIDGVQVWEREERCEKVR